jgi:hypothetical protein
MKLGFSRLVFEKKISNIKFHENPSSESRFVPCGRTDGHRDRQTVCAEGPKRSQNCSRVFKMQLLIRIQKVPPKYGNVDYFIFTAVSHIKTHF